MNRIIRLMPIMVTCIATQVIAGDLPEPAAAESAKSAAPAATADTTSPTNSASAPVNPQQTPREDKTLTNAEVSQLLAHGYKPQKGRDESVLYCRSEPQMGTRFEKKICMTGDQLKSQTRDSKDVTAQFQRDSGSPIKK